MTTHDLFATAFVTLFLVIDPIGNATWFSIAARKHGQAARVRMALKGCFVALLVVPLFIWGGNDLLRILHIHLPSFQIAGGLLLLLVAVKMVLEEEPDVAEVDASVKDLAMFPLAIPFIAGPDTLSASLLLVSREDFSGYTWIVLAGFGSVLLLSLLLLIIAGPMARLLGESILNGLSKVLGMLLAAYAIEFIIEGASSAFHLHAIR